MPDSLETELGAVFEAARSAQPLQFIFALVRVEGITSTRDPIGILRDSANQGAPLDQPTYCALLKPAESLLALIENLTRLIRGEPFDPFPFRALLPWAIHRKEVDQPRELAEMSEFTATHLEELGKHGMAQALRRAYPTDLPDVCGELAAAADSTRAVCHRLLSTALRKYSEELAAFKARPTLHRLDGFEVLELLCDEEGLCGFRLHFSNGTSARFERGPDFTDSVNVIPDVPLQFMVGDSGALTQEWRVGDKLLHEIGLRGRYNDFGQWKPLVFPGDADQLMTRIRELSDDPDIQGALLYMHCTGHRVFEFAAVMEAELPAQIMTAGDRFHLYKCNPSEDQMPMPTQFVYDGWVDLPEASAEAVAAGLQDVVRLMNRTALAVDGSVVWRPKYTLRARGGSAWLGEDIDELNAIFAAYPTGADGEAIDSAVDWYNRGASAGNPFTEFLCYYIAIESLTHAVFDGEATLGLAVDRIADAGERRERLAELFAQLYPEDPEEFVRRAYSDVIVGSTERTRRLVTAVFGDGSREFELLFAKTDGASLTDLRSRLAHGLASELTSSESRKIRERVGEVRTICRHLILRLLLRIQPGQPLPGSRRAAKMSFSDPRSTLICSSLDMLPQTDWAIRPEWVLGD